MKKIFCALFSILMVLPFLSVHTAAFTNMSDNEIVVEEGKPIYCENVTIQNIGEYRIITIDVTASDEPASTYAIVPQHTIRYYYHIIEDRNDRTIAVFNSTVTGEISTTNPKIISIQGYFTDIAVSSTLSYTTEYNNNWGKAHIKLAGVTIGTIQYTINTSGEISCS